MPLDYRSYGNYDEVMTTTTEEIEVRSAVLVLADGVAVPHVVGQRAFDWHEMRPGFISRTAVSDGQSWSVGFTADDGEATIALVNQLVSTEGARERGWV